jgi:hypothetical protein
MVARLRKIFPCFSTVAVSSVQQCSISIDDTPG